MRKSSVIGLLLPALWAASAWAQGLDLSTQNGLLEDRTNAGTTGTTLYTLTKLNGSGQAVIAATSDSNGVRGVTVGGAGTSGNAQIAVSGTAALLLDGTGTAGDFVQISSTTGGYGHDTRASTCPTSGQTIGKIVASGGPSSSYYVALGSFGCGSGGSTGFTNVYTGHGTYTWSKPSGISWVNAYCVGAGSGGSSGAVSAAADGGGGGISSAVTSAAAGGTSVTNAGATAGASGANPTNIAIGSAVGSAGGGGGSCSTAGCTAGDGGTGADGAGGGGGGAVIAATGTSGAGGAGGDGVCVISGD